VKIEERIDIARPPEDVYALVSDVERGPEWQPTLVRVEVREVAGQEREASFDVTRNEAPRLFEIVSRGGPVRASATFELTPDGAGTRVHLALVLELSGPLRFAGGMVRGRAEREARENLERLKALLEA
jgi:carbon monoxide dehydrogenase subunit G